MSIKEELQQISGANDSPGGVVVCDDDKLIEHNAWGSKGYKRHLNIYSHLAKAQPGQPIGGADWDIIETSGGVMLYAGNIIFGHKPWSPDSTTPLLPRKVEDAYGANVNFRYRAEGTGQYNVALDCWICAGNVSPNTRVGEIMVWFYSQGGKQPAGRLVSNAGDYEVWYAPPEGERFHSIVTYRCKFHKNDGDEYSGLLLKDAFFARGWFPKGTDYLLADVEIGAEVWSGRGAMIVERMQVMF